MHIHARTGRGENRRPTWQRESANELVVTTCAKGLRLATRLTPPLANTSPTRPVALCAANRHHRVTGSVTEGFSRLARTVPVPRLAPMSASAPQARPPCHRFGAQTQATRLCYPQVRPPQSSSSRTLSSWPRIIHTCPGHHLSVELGNHSAVLGSDLEIRVRAIANRVPPPPSAGGMRSTLYNAWSVSLTISSPPPRLSHAAVDIASGAGAALRLRASSCSS